MDGNPSIFQPQRDSQPGIRTYGNLGAPRRCLGATLLAACSLLVPSVFAAEVPPTFTVEGTATPIQEAVSISQDPRSHIVRPDARLLRVRQPLTENARRAVVVRPKARIHLDRSSAIQPTAGTSDGENSVAIVPPAAEEPSSHATFRRNVTVEEALEMRGSVTFRKTPLSEVVFLLSDLWHINIVAGENVSGDVSGAFHNAPLREVLSAALTATGYGYRQTGNSLIVLPVDQIGADDPAFVSQTVRIPTSLAGDESTIEAARLLLTERGQLQRIGSDSILVVDMPERIDRVRQLFSDLTAGGTPDDGVQSRLTTTDSEHLASAQVAAGSTTSVMQSGIAYFSPQFTEAEELAVPLREALGDTVVVATYPEENRIMVRGSQEDLRISKEAIEQLDRPRSQVRITAMIYDVGLREIERLGVNWANRPHSSGLALADLNDEESLRFRNIVNFSTGLIADTSAPGAASLGFSTINDNLDTDLLIQALDQSSEAKLLADPMITVGDRREASIRIVQKIPILAADPVENSGVVFSQVQFEEAGVILNVTPRISRDGTIDLQVNPEYSVVADFIENNPVIDSRTAQTVVRVANGQTFVLGGLRQRSVVESVRGVPWLKDLKHVGKLFRSHETEIRESELIVFLKPELITTCEPGTPRQQMADQVANKQLDAIPHADERPLTPCCRDPHCPNHHPRPKINGGSRSLEMMGPEAGIQSPYPVHNVEIIDHGVAEPLAGEHELHGVVQPPADRRPDLEVPLSDNDIYPPVHVDIRIADLESSQ